MMIWPQSVQLKAVKLALQLLERKETQTTILRNVIQSTMQLSVQIVAHHLPLPLQPKHLQKSLMQLL
uniref:Uncharacterized protein n=1 Tax=Arundo donax TaxID=35708 RepID=A0A0A9D8F2_ARUDO